MNDRNWDAELKKIDRHLEGMSDEAMFPAKAAPNAPEKAQAKAVQASTSTFGVFLRLTLSVALGVGLAFWPYGARCGLGLAAFLASVTTLIVAGGWSAAWTWRHRAAKGHVLSLLLVLWGLVLAGLDVLPRVGYAKPTAAHPALWSCS